MKHNEKENRESEEIESEERQKLEELKKELKKLDLEERKKIVIENTRRIAEKYRNRLQGNTEKNENQNTNKELPTPKKSPDRIDDEKLTLRPTESKEQNHRIKLQEEAKRKDEKNKMSKNAEKTRDEEQKGEDTHERKESRDKKKEEEKPKPTITKSLNDWIPRSKETQKETEIEKKEAQDKREIKQKEFKEKQEKEKSDLKKSKPEKPRLYPRRETDRIDFQEDKHFTYNVLGKEVKIEVSEKDGFKVKLENYELKAKKFVTEIGPKNHFTIIEYETETGKFTVIKEINEIWPPWVLPWYLQQQGSQVYLDSNMLKSLVENAEQIEGNVDKLVKLSGVAKTTLIAQSKGQRESISLKNLMSLIVFVGMNQKDGGPHKVKELMKNIEGSITQVGHIEGKLHIDLLNEKGAAFLARSLGDGGITAEGNAVHFGYTNTDIRNIQDVKGLLKDIYGLEVEESDRREEKGAYDIQVMGVPGFTLNRAGVPVGKHAERNSGIPLWFTLFADENMIVEFLKAMSNDEGTTPQKFLKIPQNLANPDLEKYREIFDPIIQERREKLVRKKGKLSKLDDLGIRFVGLGALENAAGEELKNEIVEEARKSKMKMLEDTVKIMEKIGVKTRSLDVGGFTVLDNHISARWDLRLNTENTRKLDKMGALGRKALKKKRENRDDKLTL